MKSIKVNIKDYNKNIDGDFIHISISGYPEENDMIDKNGNLIPLYITRRSGGKKPDYWGFCGGDGYEYKVEFN